MNAREMVIASLKQSQGYLNRSLEGLTQEDVTWKPGEHCNSIAFILWHATRVEDYFFTRVLQRKTALYEAAAARGLSITEGGRFYHLTSNTDKGKAMEKILSWYREVHDEVITIALGDSPNDAPMLERADHPVLVRSKHDYSRLRETIPRLRITREKGPLGWNSTVQDILDSG